MGKNHRGSVVFTQKKERVIPVYLTNELIRDQVRSIADIAEVEGLKPYVFTTETSKEEYFYTDVVLGLQIKLA